MRRVGTAAGLLFTILLTSLTYPFIGHASAQSSLRGRLTLDNRGEPLLLTASGQRVHLRGDEKTVAVLKDARLQGEELEVVGHFTPPDHFRIGPFHKKSFFVLRNGKRFTVYYWCDVCSIRSYVPGNCECCQQPTELRLEEVSGK